MAEKIVLKLDKPVQIFEINGLDFNVYYDDETIENYKDALLNFSKEYDTLKVKDVDKLSKEEADEVRAKQIKLIENLIEVIFGEDSYEKIYMLTGKSMLNLLDVIEAFSGWLSDKFSKYKQEKQKYYKPSRTRKNASN